MSSDVYRTPTVLFSSGLVFRAAQRLTQVALVLVALAALGHLFAADLTAWCMPHYGYDACTLGSFGERIGLDLQLQGTILSLCPWLPLTVLALDVAAAVFLLRPRKVWIDHAARTVCVRVARWPRRPMLSRVAFDDVQVRVRRALGLTRVELLDGIRVHAVTGFGRAAKAERIAESLREAVAAGV
jgi:hypothetical protein